MADLNTATSINWWQSRTILAAIVSGASSLLALSGHAISPDVQTQLVGGLIDLANGLAVVASLVAAYYRVKSTSTIKTVAVVKPDPTPPPG